MLILPAILPLVAGFIDGAASLHCLVLRPGHGLTSEKCPRMSISCRVRIERKSVEWYQYSKLYDRNQFACVMYNEYNGRERSGCVEKPSGTARCWCYGQNNCNTAKNMKKIYRAFKAGSKSELERVIDEIENSEVSDYGDEGILSDIGMDKERFIQTSPFLPQNRYNRNNTKSKEARAESAILLSTMTPEIDRTPLPWHSNVDQPEEEEKDWNDASSPASYKNPIKERQLTGNEIVHDDASDGNHLKNQPIISKSSKIATKSPYVSFSKKPIDYSKKKDRVIIEFDDDEYAHGDEVEGDDDEMRDMYLQDSVMSLAVIPWPSPLLMIVLLFGLKIHYHSNS